MSENKIEVFTLINEFNKRKQKIDRANKLFDKYKKSFYSKMLNNDIDSIKVKNFYSDDEEISATKIQSTTITFDVDKVEKKIGKKHASEIISKEYTISDFEGLIKYLKSIGANPKKFKQFIEVNKTIDRKKLDNLEELGLLSLDDLAGTYEVKVNNPYYKVSTKSIKSEEYGED